MTKDSREVICSAFDEVQSGFLDVKVPAKGRRKPFGSWNSWKRHWVSASSNSDGEVDLSLSSSPETRITQTVRLPITANLCRTKSRSRLHAFAAVLPDSGNAVEDRTNYLAKGTPSDSLVQNESPCIYLAGRTETESQRWMEALRSMLGRPTYTKFEEPAFTVTFSDTAFARKLGLSGVTGLLTTKRGIGVMLHDVMTGVLLASWKCSMIRNSHTAGDSMVIIVTTKEFPVGEGQFQLHCSKAAFLARALNSIGHPINLALQRGRRLSRSEGDLFLEFQQNHQPPLPSREPQLRAKHSFSPLRLLATRRRAETMVQSTRSLNVSGSPPPTALSALGGKIASSLLSAGLGLILSTPGGSEAEDNDEDSELGDVEYSDVEDDALNTTLVSQDGERRASVTSGIYEEIYENAAAAALMRLEPQHEDPYEDPNLLFSPVDWPGNLSQDPPPLPPRHNIPSLDDFKSQSMSSVLQKNCVALPDWLLGSRADISIHTKRTAVPEPVMDSITTNLNGLSSNESSSSIETGSTESHYVSMSQSRHSAPPSCPAESYYMPMSSPRNCRLLEEAKPTEDIKSCLANR